MEWFALGKLLEDVAVERSLLERVKLQLTGPDGQLGHRTAQ